MNGVFYVIYPLFINEVMIYRLIRIYLVVESFIDVFLYYLWSGSFLD